MAKNIKKDEQLKVSWIALLIEIDAFLCNIIEQNLPNKRIILKRIILKRIINVLKMKTKFQQLSVEGKLMKSLKDNLKVRLSHLFPMHSFLPPENIRKPYVFILCFQGVEKGCIGKKWVKKMQFAKKMKRRKKQLAVLWKAMLTL